MWNPPRAISGRVFSRDRGTSMLTFTDRETEASEGVVGGECREGQSPGPLASLLPCGGMACVLCHKIAPPRGGAVHRRALDGLFQTGPFFFPPLNDTCSHPNTKWKRISAHPAGGHFVDVSSGFLSSGGNAARPLLVREPEGVPIPRCRASGSPSKEAAAQRRGWLWGRSRRAGTKGWDRKKRKQ